MNTARKTTVPSTARLKRLPLWDDAWQVDVRPVPASANGKASRRWMTAVVSEADEEVVALTVTEQRPTAATVWHLLVEAILNPEDCDPFRPRQVQVRPESKLRGLRPLLSAIDIGFALEDDLDLIDDLFGQLNEDYHEDYHRCLLDMPGVTPSMVRSAFRAAAAYYRKAPWKQVKNAVIRVDCPCWKDSLYAIITGAGNTKPGLVLAREPDTVKRLRHGRMARSASALAVVFGSRKQMTETDLEMAEQYKLPVAGPRAYPAFVSQESGTALRPLLDHELHFLDGVLRAIPKFLTARRPANARPFVVQVRLPIGERKLAISWTI